MNPATVLCLFAATFRLIHAGDNGLTGCYSNQQLELNHTDAILCQFPPEFMFVYWYEDATENADPILTYNREKPPGSRKYGPGYESAEYDMGPDGSLLIENVSFHHERVFKVVLFETKSVFHNFRMNCTIKVTSSQALPHIDGCSAESPWCFLQPTLPGTINCSFAGARPAAQIQWQRNIGNIIENINTSTGTIVQEHSKVTFTTRASLTAYNGNKTMVLYVCNAKHRYEDTWRSTNLLINSLNERPSNKTEWQEMYHVVGDKVTMPCSVANGSFISSWRRIIDGNYSVIGYKVNDYTETLIGYLDDFQITYDSSLVIKSLRRSHEGKYTCITSDGNSQQDGDGVNLTAIVPPSPLYLALEECAEVNCLTCFISGIHPEVSLYWKPNDIEVKHVQTETRVENDLFYVHSRLTYDPGESCQDHTITCCADGIATRTFNRYKDFVVKGTQQCNPATVETYVDTHVAIPMVVSIALLACLVASFCITAALKHYNKLQWCRNNPNETTSEEAHELLEKGLRGVPQRQLIKELRSTYSERLKNCLQTKLGGKIFYVPNDIVYRKSANTMFDSSHEERLNAFQEIFTTDQLKKSHVVIEAKAGFGKSTLAMIMMEQWINEDKKSPIGEYPILIVLDLQKTAEGQTLVQMIKSSLLPEDTPLTENDIKEIISDGKGCLFIFENVEDRLSGNEVSAVLNRKRLIEAKAVVFSRPTTSINSLSAGVVRFSLVPFTESQVFKYIEEYSAFYSAAKKLGDRLKNSDLLMTICVYPQFLAITSKKYEISESSQEDREFSTITDFVNQLMDSAASKNVELDEIIGGKAFTLSSQGKLSKFKIKSEYSHIVKTMVGVGVLHDPLREANSSDTVEVFFQARLFQHFSGARFLVTRDDDNFNARLNEIEDISTCEELIMFASGLDKATARFQKIAEMLLDKRDKFPFTIKDTLYYCLREATLLHSRDFEEIIPIIRRLCQEEYGCRIDSSDPLPLQKVKTDLISRCAEHEIPIDTIMLWNVVSKLTEGTVHLKCGHSFQMPQNVKTYFISDMGGSVSRDQIFYLPKNTTELTEVIVYSPKVPKYVDPGEFSNMVKGDLDPLVFWFTVAEGVGGTEPEPEARVLGFNYPSINYRMWMSSLEATTIKTLRMKPDCTKMTEDEKITKISAKGVDEYIKSYANHPAVERRRIKAHMKKKLQCIGRIICELGKIFEAQSLEEANEHVGLYQRELVHLGAMLTKSLQLEEPLTTTIPALSSTSGEGGRLTIRQLTEPLQEIYRKLRI